MSWCSASVAVLNGYVSGFLGFVGESADNSGVLAVNSTFACPLPQQKIVGFSAASALVGHPQQDTINPI
jgi:hypothetical protein